MTNLLVHRVDKKGILMYTHAKLFASLNLCLCTGICVTIVMTANFA